VTSPGTTRSAPAWMTRQPIAVHIRTERDRAHSRGKVGGQGAAVGGVVAVVTAGAVVLALGGAAVLLGVLLVVVAVVLVRVVAVVLLVSVTVSGAVLVTVVWVGLVVAGLSVLRVAEPPKKVVGCPLPVIELPATRSGTVNTPTTIANAARPVASARPQR
jgi:hypothetical protein